MRAKISEKLIAVGTPREIFDFINGRIIYKGVGRPPIPDIITNKILELYDNNNDLSAITISKIIGGISKNTVNEILFKHGRRKRDINKQRYKSSIQKNPEIDRLAKEGKTIREISKIIGLSYNKVYNYIKKYGLEFNKDISFSHKLNEDKINKIKELYLKNVPIPDIAKRFGINEGKIEIDYINREKIMELYNKKVSISEIAKQLNLPYPKLVYRIDKWRNKKE